MSIDKDLSKEKDATVLKPRLRISASQSDWQYIDSSNSKYSKIITEVLRRCPTLQEEHQNVPTTHVNLDATFVVYEYPLTFYKYYNLVYLKRTLPQNYKVDEFYGLIPKETSGIFAKQNYQTVGNFYPLFKVEQLIRFNRIMGLTLSELITNEDYEKSHQPTSGRDLKKALDENQQKALKEFILLNLALRNIRISESSFNHLLQLNEVQLLISPTDKKLNIHVEKLTLKPSKKSNTPLTVSLQIVPESGEVFFLYQGTSVDESKTINSARFGILNRTRTATPIVNSWQPCSDTTASRLRYELMLSYNMPVQHINAAIFRQARLNCYKHVHLIEILVPELGMYRQSYLLWPNLNEAENILWGVIQRKAGYSQHDSVIQSLKTIDNEIAHRNQYLLSAQQRNDPSLMDAVRLKADELIVEYERCGVDANFELELDLYPLDNDSKTFIRFHETYPLDFSMDKIVEGTIDHEVVENIHPLQFYVKFYAWSVYSFHLLHHPFSLGYKQYHDEDTMKKLSTIHSLPRIDEAWFLNGQLAKSIELDPCLFINRQLLIQKIPTISSTTGKIGFFDKPYAYNYHRFAFNEIYFGSEPLSILRKEQLAYFQHYLLRKKLYESSENQSTTYSKPFDWGHFLPDDIEAYRSQNDISNFHFISDVSLPSLKHFDCLSISSKASLFRKPGVQSQSIKTDHDRNETVVDDLSSYECVPCIMFNHCIFNERFKIDEFSILPKLIFYRCEFKKGFEAPNVHLQSSVVFIQCRFDPIPFEIAYNDNLLSNTVINLFNSKIDGELAFHRCLMAGRMQAAGLQLARSFRLRGTIIKETIRDGFYTSINKNIPPDNEIKTYEEQAIRFRNITNIGVLGNNTQIFKTILKNFLVRSHKVKKNKTIMDFFSEHEPLELEIGSTGRKVKLSDYRPGLEQFLKETNLQYIIEGIVDPTRKNRKLHPDCLDFLHHLLLDPNMGPQIFGRTRFIRYQNRLRETRLLLNDEQNVSHSWHQNPALSLEYAKIGGDLEFVAAPHEPFYSTNIEECFNCVNNDVGRAWVSHISSHLMLRNIDVVGNVSFTGFVCQGDIDLTLAKINGDVIGFSETAYNQYIRTPHMVVRGSVNLNDAVIRGYIKFYRGVIHQSLTLYSAKVDGNVDLHGLHVGHDLDLTYCEISGYLYAVENMRIARLLPMEQFHGNLTVEGDMILSGANISKVECRGIVVSGGIYIINGVFGQLIFSVGVRWVAESLSLEQADGLNNYENPLKLDYSDQSENMQDSEYLVIAPYKTRAAYVVIRTITVSESIDLTGIQVLGTSRDQNVRARQSQFTNQGLQLTNSTIHGDLEFSSEHFIQDLENLFKHSSMPVFFITDRKILENHSDSDFEEEILYYFGSEPKQIHIRSNIQGNLKLYGNRIQGHLDLRNTFVEGDILLNDTTITRRLNLGSIYKVDIDFRAGLKTQCHRLEMDRLACDGEVNFAGLHITGGKQNQSVYSNDQTQISLSATNVKITNTLFFILPPRHAKEEYVINNKFPNAVIRNSANFTGSEIFRLTIIDKNFPDKVDASKLHPMIDLDRCKIDHLMLVKTPAREQELVIKHKYSLMRLLFPKNKGFPVLSIANATIHTWELMELKENNAKKGQLSTQSYQEPKHPIRDYIGILNNAIRTDKKVWLGLESQLRQSGLIREADKIHYHMNTTKSDPIQKKEKKSICFPVLRVSERFGNFLTNHLFSIKRKPLVSFLLLIISCFMLSSPHNISLSLSAHEVFKDDLKPELSNSSTLTYYELCQIDKLKNTTELCHSWSMIDGVILSLQYIIPLIDNEFESAWQARTKELSEAPNYSVDKHCKNVLPIFNSEGKAGSWLNSVKSSWNKNSQNVCRSVLKHAPQFVLTPNQFLILCAFFFWLTILSYSLYSFQALRYGK